LNGDGPSSRHASVGNESVSDLQLIGIQLITTHQDCGYSGNLPDLLLRVSLFSVITRGRDGAQ